MRCIICLLIILLSAVNLCLAQTDSTTTSSSLIPKEMKGELLHVEKYSELSSDESSEIVNVRTVKSERDECLENIYAYNLVFRRKMNNEIESIFDSYKLGNINLVSTRDIKENLDNNIRFILKAQFSAEDMVKGDNYSPYYYIYDQDKDIKYKSFRSLEVFLESLESFNWYAANRITDETSQRAVDDYIERNLPNEQKPIMSKSTRNVILGTLAFVGLNILSYVVSN
ncbi:MAG: hypothetical protein HRT58_06475 [Crocinitomicaceae bacterium]|nr:hypothetical protein [Flavobacteriales bacterium]NQZ35290.1 hypothetical protein [Crocinitomicaceae bacterium]